MTYTLEIPGWRPALSNELRCHWRKAARLKAADTRMVWQAMVAHGVPRATGKRRVSITMA